MRRHVRRLHQVKDLAYLLHAGEHAAIQGERRICRLHLKHAGERTGLRELQICGTVAACIRDHLCYRNAAPARRKRAKRDVIRRVHMKRLAKRHRAIAVVRARVHDNASEVRNRARDRLKG